MLLFKVEDIKRGMNVRLKPEDFQYAEVVSNAEAFGDDPVQVFSASPSVPPVQDHTTIVVLVDQMISGFVFPNGHTLMAGQCLDMAMGADDCEGRLIARPSRAGTGMSLMRCEKHERAREEQHEKHIQRYPDSPTPPDWFDESYAGESWDEDY